MPARVDHLRGPARPRRAPRPALAGVHAAEDGRHRAARCAQFCARSLDPLVGAGGFDFIADLGAEMPMRTIGMLLGIPEQDQQALRDRIDARPAHGRGRGRARRRRLQRRHRPGQRLRRLHRLAGRPPLRRPHDRAARRRVRGRRQRHASTAHPRRDPQLSSTSSPRPATRPPPASSAGPGKVLAEHPDQRRELAEDRVAGPQADRGDPALRGAVAGAGPLRHRRRRALRPDRPRGQRHPAAQRRGQPRRPRVPRRRLASTSTARSATTCRSGTASTSASAPRWPASRVGSRSTRSSSASPSGTSTGTRPSRPARRPFAGWESPPRDHRLTIPLGEEANMAADGMQMDDMILVSIDDHMIEPPDMYENHVPAKWKDEAPKVVRNEDGIDEWVFQGETTSHPLRHGRHGRLAGRGVGLQPRHLLRAAPGLLRRARAGARHGRQRRPRVDVLPDDGRLQRPHVHRGGRQGDRPRHAPGVQRLGHRRVVRRLPGPLHPARHRADVGRRAGRRGGAPHRQEGLPLDQLPRDAARAGLPELPLGLLGPDVQGAVRREHGAVAAHRRRLRGHQAAGGGPGRPPHGAGLPDQRHHRPGPAVRPDACGRSPT